MAATKRHPATRAQLLARMPRAFRPKLTAAQLRDLGLCHCQNLDAISTGQAGPDMLWSYIGGVLTWWKASRLLQLGEPEMDVQLEVATRLVERFGRHRVVRFDGPDLQHARDGVMVMDLLAEAIDMPTATIAAEWGESEVNRLAAAVAKVKQQQECTA